MQIAHNARDVWYGTSPHDHNPHDRFPFLGNNYTFISILENFLSLTPLSETYAGHLQHHTQTQCRSPHCEICMEWERVFLRIIVFLCCAIDIIVACGDVYRFASRSCRTHTHTHSHSVWPRHSHDTMQKIHTHLLSNSKVNEFSDNLQHIAFQKSCSIWHVSKTENAVNNRVRKEHEKNVDAENLFRNLPFKFNYKIFTKYTCIKTLFHTHTQRETQTRTPQLIRFTHSKLSTWTVLVVSMAMRKAKSENICSWREHILYISHNIIWIT